LELSFQIYSRHLLCLCVKHCGVQVEADIERCQEFLRLHRAAAGARPRAPLLLAHHRRLSQLLCTSQPCTGRRPVCPAQSSSPAPASAARLRSPWLSTPWPAAAGSPAGADLAPAPAPERGAGHTPEPVYGVQEPRGSAAEPDTPQDGSPLARLTAEAPGGWASAHRPSHGCVLAGAAGLGLGLGLGRGAPAADLLEPPSTAPSEAGDLAALGPGFDRGPARASEQALRSPAYAPAASRPAGGASLGPEDTLAMASAALIGMESAGEAAGPEELREASPRPGARDVGSSDAGGAEPYSCAASEASTLARRSSPARRGASAAGCRWLSPAAPPAAPAGGGPDHLADPAEDPGPSRMRRRLSPMEPLAAPAGAGGAGISVGVRGLSLLVDALAAPAGAGPIEVDTSLLYSAGSAPCSAPASAPQSPRSGPGSAPGSPLPGPVLPSPALEAALASPCESPCSSGRDLRAGSDGAANGALLPRAAERPAGAPAAASGTLHAAWLAHLGARRRAAHAGPAHALACGSGTPPAERPLRPGHGDAWVAAAGPCARGQAASSAPGANQESGEGRRQRAVAKQASQEGDARCRAGGRPRLLGAPPRSVSAPRERLTCLQIPQAHDGATGPEVALRRVPASPARARRAPARDEALWAGLFPAPHPGSPAERGQLRTGSAAARPRPGPGSEAARAARLAALARPRTSAWAAAAAVRRQGDAEALAECSFAPRTGRPPAARPGGLPAAERLLLQAASRAQQARSPRSAPVLGGRSHDRRQGLHLRSHAGTSGASVDARCSPCPCRQLRHRLQWVQPSFSVGVLDLREDLWKKPICAAAVGARARGAGAPRAGRVHVRAAADRARGRGRLHAAAAAPGRAAARQAVRPARRGVAGQPRRRMPLLIRSSAWAGCSGAPRVARRGGQPAAMVHAAAAQRAAPKRGCGAPRGVPRLTRGCCSGASGAAQRAVQRIQRPTPPGTCDRSRGRRHAAASGRRRHGMPVDAEARGVQGAERPPRTERASRRPSAHP